MAEWDYGDETPYDDWSWDRGGTDFTTSPAWRDFLSWGNPTGPGSSGDPNADGGGGMNWLTSILGSLGSLSGVLGPALSAAGSLAGGAMGANASSDAARLQAAALNRGLDLQTAQWLQQQANQAPWLQAGQQALGHLRGRMDWAGPQQPEVAPAISGANYALPSATPGWQPQTYQGPASVDPHAYRYTPGAVPTLQGADLLANDPGYQFRQDEARKALEASAMARGAGMSGATLSALQRQAQDLASQEYGQAWNRASQQAQMREGWAQQASQMGFGQALAGQGQQFTQGLQAQQWNQGQAQQYDQELYNRLLGQSTLRYGQDVEQNQTDYQRQQQAYQQQVAELQRQWGNFAGVAGVGQAATNQLGEQGLYAQRNLSSLLSQLGTAQGGGALGGALAWQRALTGAGNQLPSILRSLNS